MGPWKQLLGTYVRPAHIFTAQLIRHRNLQKFSFVAKIAKIYEETCIESTSADGAPPISMLGGSLRGLVVILSRILQQQHDPQAARQQSPVHGDSRVSQLTFIGALAPRRDSHTSRTSAPQDNDGFPVHGLPAMACCLPSLGRGNRSRVEGHLPGTAYQSRSPWAEWRWASTVHVDRFYMTGERVLANQHGGAASYDDVRLPSAAYCVETLRTRETEFS